MDTPRVTDGWSVQPLIMQMTFLQAKIPAPAILGAGRIAIPTKRIVSGLAAIIPARKILEHRFVNCPGSIKNPDPNLKTTATNSQSSRHDLLIVAAVLTVPGVRLRSLQM